MLRACWQGFGSPSPIPGKSLRCAINAFAAFLIQFLGGDEKQTQHRRWLSLRESHARFQSTQRMVEAHGAGTSSGPFDEQTRAALGQFFLHASNYVIGVEASEPEQEELATRWKAQRVLDDVIAWIAAGRDSEAIALARRLASRPSVYVGLLARITQARHPKFIRFVVHAVEREPGLATGRFNRRTLLHFASGAGCTEVVTLLLRLGTDPEVQDRGGHTPLCRAANECSTETGPEIVRALVRAGADVNAYGGVTRGTALHMAARPHGYCPSVARLRRGRRRPRQQGRYTNATRNQLQTGWGLEAAGEVDEVITEGYTFAITRAKSSASINPLARFF